MSLSDIWVPRQMINKEIQIWISKIISEGGRCPTPEDPVQWHSLRGLGDVTASRPRLFHWRREEGGSLGPFYCGELRSLFWKVKVLWVDGRLYVSFVSVLDKACVGESTRQWFVLYSKFRKYKLKRKLSKWKWIYSIWTFFSPQKLNVVDAFQEIWCFWRREE